MQTHVGSSNQPTWLASKLLVLSSKRGVLVHSGTDKTYFWLAWCLDLFGQQTFRRRSGPPSSPVDPPLLRRQNYRSWWIAKNKSAVNTATHQRRHDEANGKRRHSVHAVWYSFRMSNWNFTFTGRLKRHPSCPLSSVWKIPQNRLKYCSIT